MVSLPFSLPGEQIADAPQRPEESGVMLGQMHMMQISPTCHCPAHLMAKINEAPGMSSRREFASKLHNSGHHDLLGVNIVAYSLLVAYNNRCGDKDVAKEPVTRTSCGLDTRPTAELPMLRR
jgi:hypothetical protein